MTDGVFEFQVPVDEAEKFFHWTECAAFRFVLDGDRLRLQVTNDLERITDPEAGE